MSSCDRPMRPGDGGWIALLEMGDLPMSRPMPTEAQGQWLRRGLDQPGGKLPLFLPDGRKVSPQTVRACIEAGWAEPWFTNPVKPDWLVCKLTEQGRAAAILTHQGEPAGGPAP